MERRIIVGGVFAWLCCCAAPAQEAWKRPDDRTMDLSLFGAIRLGLEEFIMDSFTNMLRLLSGSYMSWKGLVVMNDPILFDTDSFEDDEDVAESNDPFKNPAVDCLFDRKELISILRILVEKMSYLLDHVERNGLTDYEQEEEHMTQPIKDEESNHEANNEAITDHFVDQQGLKVDKNFISSNLESDDDDFESHFDYFEKYHKYIPISVYFQRQLEKQKKISERESSGTENNPDTQELSENDQQFEPLETDYQHHIAEQSDQK